MTSTRAGKDYTGRRFGKLTAVKPLRKNKVGALNTSSWVWEFKCDCGGTIEEVACLLASRARKTIRPLSCKECKGVHSKVYISRVSRIAAAPVANSNHVEVCVYGESKEALVKIILTEEESLQELMNALASSRKLFKGEKL